MHDENITIIEIRSKKNLLSFFLAIYLSGIGVIAIVLFIPFNNLITGIGSILLVLIGIFGLRLLLWILFGKEKIVMTKMDLLVIKKGSFYLPLTRISLKEIESIKIDYSFIERENGFKGFKGLVTEMSYKMPYLKILNYGRIAINFNSKQYRILNGLSVEEGLEVIEEINKLKAES
jgi:hypothetical protein